LPGRRKKPFGLYLAPGHVGFCGQFIQGGEERVRLANEKSIRPERCTVAAARGFPPRNASAF
jgi:hypothetical protein